jgi:short-subunit dehydrogenase
VALSQALLGQLRVAKARIGVSVLCPGLVETQIGTSARNRPERLKNEAPARPSRPQQQTVAPMAPDVVADAALQAIRQERFYVLPVQEEWKQGVASVLTRRAGAIIEGMGTQAVSQ